MPPPPLCALLPRVGGRGSEHAPFFSSHQLSGLVPQKSGVRNSLVLGSREGAKDGKGDKRGRIRGNVSVEGAEEK